MRNWLEYIPFIVIASLVRSLPRSLALGLGRKLGSLGRLIQPRRVRIADKNLLLAFPEMSDNARQSTITRMFAVLGASFVDMLRLDLYRGPGDLDRYFKIQGQAHLEDARQLGRGCIILTAHVGFWEAGTFFLPQLGIQTGVVAKPMRNTLVDTYFQRMRTANGTYIINSRKGARGILKALQKNHCVCILLDQHLKGQGSVKAPFFGHPAHTTTIITQMATRYQIPIVSAFVYRQPDDTYTCHFSEPCILEGDLSDENILANTSKLNKMIENGVREDISQWFWVHRRWRPCCEQ